jgi:LPS export ABC transporter protein LptC
MNSNAFNYLALLAAIVVGYGVFVSSEDPDESLPNVAGVMQGYYLRDAVITETTAEGAPHFRVAASEVAQNLQEKFVALNSLRVDYLKPADEKADEDEAAAHWVLNADRGTAFDNFRRLALQGNVQAHNLGAPRAIVFDTYSLDIDMEKETLKTRDAVEIGIDKSRVNGRGFFADLARERFTLDSNVGLRVAQAERSAKPSEISLPDAFEAETFEYRDNVWTLIKVRSKTPPFVQADTLRATGADLANNKIAMRGSVRVELPQQGQITSDTALVSVRNNQV